MSPLFDSILAIWRRTSRKILARIGFEHSYNKLIMTADKEHLHHRVLGKVKSQRIATLILYSISFILGLFAVSFVLIDSKSHGMVFIILMILFVVIFKASCGCRVMEFSTNSFLWFKETSEKYFSIFYTSFY